MHATKTNVMICC